MLRQGLTVTIAGLLVGLLGAAGMTHLPAGMLFSISPLDAASFGSAALVLVWVAVAACLFPAYRAAGVEPIEVLQVE